MYLEPAEDPDGAAVGQCAGKREVEEDSGESSTGSGAEGMMLLCSQERFGWWGTWSA
jgi:hypothetical protein